MDLNPVEFLIDKDLGLVKETRDPQIQMAELVNKAINNNESAIVEAGVGTGKTYAYLLPVLLNNKRTIVSTATINLQSQIINKDIPHIKRALNAQGFDTSVGILKGKSNYVCPLAVEDHKTKLNKEFLSWSDAVAAGISSGDKEEFKGQLPSNWHELSAEECISKQCPKYKTCGTISSRKEAINSKCVIMNHALLGTYLLRGSLNLTLGTGEFNVVLDEAHKAAEVFRNTFSFVVKETDADRLLKRISSVGITYPAAEHEYLTIRFKKLFTSLPFNDDGTLLSSSFSISKDCCVDILTVLSKLEQKIGPLPTTIMSDYKSYRNKMTVLKKLRQLYQAFSILHKIFSGAEDLRHVAFTKREQTQKQIHVVPLDIKQEIASAFGTNSVIATSATLCGNNSFDHIINDLGLEAENLLSVKSPFDYAANAVLYVPSDLPAINEEYGNAKFIDRLHKILSITNGRALVLFTSVADMDIICGLLQTKYPRWKCVKQSRLDTPASVLNAYLQLVAQNQPAVLFGLKSFFEGISVEGESLVNVVLTKLPFPPISDPLYKAKCKAAGDKSFSLVTLPEMIRDLQQGTGRLIRTKSDFGIVSILDPRIHQKSYGGSVLKSLPFTTRTTDINKLESWYSNRKWQTNTH